MSHPKHEVNLPLVQKTVFGRDGELAALSAALAEAHTGRGNLVLIGGEAGIGKTTLVDIVRAKASAESWMVLTGHCYDLVTTPPFGPWIELLASFRNAYSTPETPGLLIDSTLLDTVSSQDEIFASTAGFLLDLVEDKPLVLILEDMHWSDRASLDLLRYLTRHLPAMPVLVIVTYRDLELDEDAPLYRMMPQLVRESRAKRIDLQRLDAPAIRSLLQERYQFDDVNERRLSDWLARFSEGNPFYIEELLRNLEQNATLAVDDGRWQLGDVARVDVPPLIRQVINQRLDAFNDRQRQLLQIAAVIGEDIDLDLWSKVAEVDDETLVDVIETAGENRLLVESPDRAGVQLRHALFRTTLYDSISLPRRRLLHRRIAHELAGSERPEPDTVAYHFGQAGDVEAARWLIRAGDRATRSFAYFMAAERYEQTLPLLDAAGIPLDEQGWVYCNLALSYRYAESFRALAHLDSALKIVEQIDDPALAFTVTWDRSQIRGLLGERSLPEAIEAVELFEQTIRETGERSFGRINVMSYGLLAHLLTRFGAYELAAELAEKELALLPSNDRNHQIAAGWAHFTLGLTHASNGLPEQARESLAEAKNIALSTGENHMFGLILNWELMELILPYQADQPAARQRITEQSTAAWSRITRFTKPDVSQEMLPFAVMILDGDWDRATEEAKFDSRNVTMRFDGLRTLTELDVARGDVQNARSHLFDVLPQGHGTQPGNFYYYSTLRIQRAAALLALNEGKPSEALAWINAREEWLAWANRVLDRADNLLLRSAYLQATGNKDLALDEARMALSLASEPRQPVALLAAHRMIGDLETEAGHYPQATEHLGEAMALAEACNAPNEIALTQLSLARLMASTGKDVAMRGLLDSVRAIAETLSSGSLIEEAQAIEQQFATSPKHRAGDSGLSPREIDVLQLVARGMTDAEVGEQLHISPRTVARHLQSIYNKLAVNSRTAATAFAFERGIVRSEEESGM